MPAPLVGAAVAAAARLAAKKVAQEAAKKAAKRVAAKATDKIAKNSVKVKDANKPSLNKALNENETRYTNDLKSGKLAARASERVKQMKPAKVVKINSAPAKSADAAKKSADAKALKAANKKKK